MDKTELFIRMVDCPEIQEQWKPDCGDYLRLAKPDSRIVIITEHIKPCVEKVTWLIRIAFPESTGGNLDYKYINDAIWLPQQEDLQKMIDKPLGSLCCEFYLMSMAVGPLNKFTSMEQLWLAFYMKECHSKIWEGMKWKI